jgi:WD40 repeat protein/serine/threonine protein kinase/DNA-binding XRE family transcriptional regulator
MVEEPAFGARVRKQRRGLDLTQEELARRIGCASVTLRKIENGQLRASRQIAERLAVALGIPLEEREAFVRAARTAPIERAEPREPTTSRTPLLNPEEVGSDNLSGRAIRSYQLGECIGKGGFGAVYRAVQPGIEREVAIKLILPLYADQPEFIRRFESEARVIARLEHPHIVPLYDYWRDPGFAFLVMRYLRGGSLHSVLSQGALPPRQVLQIAEQIGGALTVAHRAGVVHRDLKPSNILLDPDGNAFLADFGIAKDLNSLGVEHSGLVYVGSPAYSAPEQIRAEPITAQADIYAFGVMMYELLTGQRPFRGPTPAALIQQHLNSNLPQLREAHPDLNGGLDHILQRATAKLPAARYPDMASLLAELRIVIGGSSPAPLSQPKGASAATPTLVLDLEESDNPYKGLLAFDEADMENFFGRETLIHSLLSRLGEGSDLARFLALIGPSGSGKSSLARAGLIPALRQGGLPGSDSWYMVTFTPGAQPLAELARQLCSVAPRTVEAGDLQTVLAADELGLVRAARLVLPAEAQTELVLLIDQFEELFTLCGDVAERSHVLRSIVSAVLDERSRVRIIITLRGDFVDQTLLDVDFGELMRQRSELVLPLTPEELERAITGPARRLGLVLEDGLAATMVSDVGAQPGTLPLLQHTLSELFRRRSGRMLTRAAYNELGGVSGGLANSAEAIYQELPEETQAAVQQYMLRLVTPGLGVPDTRRRAQRSELAEVIGTQQITTISEAFGRARLLTFDHDIASREPTIEVAHETLLRVWPRLRGWIEASREALLTERRLAQATAEWLASNRDSGFLASGGRLEQFITLAAGNQVALSSDEQAYLAASGALRDQLAAEEETRRQRELVAAQQLAAAEQRRAEEQSRAATQLRRRATYLGVALALALVAMVTAGVFGNQAATNASRNAALASENAAIAATAEAARGQAEQEARISTSRELALAAINSLTIDPERSMLLALHGLEYAETLQATEALHRALLATRVERTLSLEGESIATTLYNPDETQLTAVTIDGDIAIWDIARGEPLQRLQGYALTYSPDKRTIAIITLEERIALYDATNDTLMDTFGTHPGAWNIRFAPDGKRVATGGDDQQIRIWEPENDQPLLTLKGHTEPVSGLAFNPDGTRLASVGYDGQLYIWDTKTGAKQLQLTTDNSLTGVRFSPDGTLVTSGSGHGTVYVWDSATGEEIHALGLHSNAVGEPIFTADGASIVSFSYDGTAKIWEIASGNVLLNLNHNGPIQAATLRGDETRLVTGATDGTVKIWDISVTGSREVLNIPHNAMVWRVDYSPDGMLLATASWDGQVQLYEAQTGLQRWSKLLYGGRAMDVRFSPDGTRLVTSGADRLVYVLDASDGSLLFSLRGHGTGLVGGLFAGSIAAGFSPDSRLIASAGADSTVRLWDATTGMQLWKVNTESGATNVAFSPDGSYLATTTDFGTLIEWEIASGKQHRVYIGADEATKRLWALTYSPDGQFLAAAGFGGTATVWDRTTGRQHFALGGLSATVSGIAYSSDGQILLTSSGEGVRMYDGNSGTLLLALEDPEGMRDVAFRPGNNHFVAARSDGLVRVLTTDLTELRQLARSRLTRVLYNEECEQYLHRSPCPATP